MAEITYLEAIREALFEEMERDAERLLPRRGHRRVRRRVQGHRRADRAKFGEARVIDTPISEIGIVGAAAGAAHMGMRPVVEMQFIDFIANAYDMLTNYVATARYRAFLPVPDGRARAERRVRARRAVPLAESGGGVHPHARPQGRLSGDGRRREGADEGGDPRRRLRAVLRAQVSVSPHQGRDARGRSRRADRQGARRARRDATSRSSRTRRRSGRRSRRRSSSRRRTGCRSRSSICARWRRSTTRRSRRRCGRRTAC